VAADGEQLHCEPISVIRDPVRHPHQPRPRCVTLRVDGVWGTIGSSNLDALSLVLNHEANLVLFRHPEVAGI
ncbi:hypothetical protein, partial [Mycetohabitans sp. B6]|uniref:hypothetical protein n=1 Tax=Mycetohabitans sp. B6 TaxID=2841843 RepID=UPI001F2A8195